MSQTTCYLPDQAATEALGARLAVQRPHHGVVHLIGDLGAGKTTLVRGFLQAAGHQGSVKSPTYTLIEPYSLADGQVFHLDLYRLADPEVLEFIGLRELLDEGLLLVEWPELGAGVLPDPGLVVTISVEGSGRLAQIEARDPVWQLGIKGIS